MHQGQRLKKLIEQSGLSIRKITMQTGISSGSLYNMYLNDEILKKKILPLLDLLGMDYDSFMGVPKSETDPENDLLALQADQALAILNEQLISLHAKIQDTQLLIDVIKKKMRQNKPVVHVEVKSIPTLATKLRQSTPLKSAS